MAYQLHDVRYELPLSPAHHHAAHNTVGSVALVSCTVGTIAGAIPFLFPFAAVMGAAGLLLAVIAWRRVRRGEATNVRTTRAALMLGVVALLLALVGFLAAVVATRDLAPPPNAAASITHADSSWRG